MWIKKPSVAQVADDDDSSSAATKAKEGKRPDTPTFLAAMDALALAYHAAGVWPIVFRLRVVKVSCVRFTGLDLCSWEGPYSRAT